MRLVVERGADLATYQSLVVLDALTAVTDDEDKGELQLFHVHGRDWLNDPSKEELTVLYKDIELAGE